MPMQQWDITWRHKIDSFTMNHLHTTVSPLALVFVALIAAAAPILAKELPPGPLEPLPEGEGYLLTVIDSDNFIASMHLNRLGSMLGSERLNRIEAGRTARVLRVPAGEYRWSRIQAAPTLWIGQIGNLRTAFSLLGTHRFDIKELDSSVTFRVQAGKLNYPGDLHLRFRNGMVTLSMPNRGERALPMLESTHPGGSRSHPFHYAGELTDHYWSIREPELASAVIASCPDELGALPEGTPNGRDLFRAEEISNLVLSPDGALILESAYRNGQHQINVIDPASGDVLPLYGGIADITDAQWAGRRKIVIALHSKSGVTGTQLFQLADGQLLDQPPSRKRFPVEGFVLDALPHDEDHLLFGVFRPDHDDPMQIFRIDIRGKTLRESQFHARNRIDRGVRDDHAWLNDAQGQLRLAIVEHDGAQRLIYRRDEASSFIGLRSLGLETVFSPLWIRPDGIIYALSNEDREQVELVRLDPSQPERLETVYAVPGIDLAGVERSGPAGAIVGVRYYLGGQVRSHFFDDTIRTWHARLEASFAGQYTELVDIDAGHHRAIVKVSGDTRPPSYYYYEVDAARAIAIGDGAPWLSNHVFVARQAITVPGERDNEIQALLAIPDWSHPRPLLLMPHGGPLFVQDVLRFDRDVQYWATRGFAVLQINFRGSYGFGVRHLLDGFGGFGRQIEDDIIQSLAHVIDSYPQIDATRICSLGSSYGGYSSLMLALRDPDLVRCAVSIAGPTDLPLVFTSSDWNTSRISQDAMRKVVGDPGDPALRQHSPLYRSKEFVTPVMLIHGSDDRRVDFEHTARLATLLAGHGKAFESLRIDGMGHGPETVGQNLCIMGRAEQFIRARLNIEPE